MENALSATVDQIFASYNRGIDFQSQGRRRAGLSKRELELAVAVLLVDLASCDQRFDTAEYQTIAKGLNKLFGTTVREVKQLVQHASQALGTLRGSDRFASLLKEHLPLDQRMSIMKVIDDVIHSDGVVDGFELYLRSKFANLLGLPIEPIKEDHYR